MAYNAVAQADEVASGSDSDSEVSCTPSPMQEVFHQLPNADHSLDGAPLEAASSHEQPSLGRLGSMIRSITTTSYDVVEADDYDADPSPSSPVPQSLESLQSSNQSPRRIPPLNTAVARHSSSPEPPLRSASSDLPITHPIPDLQSSQGAYVGNVARLEESAERLSSSSADIGSEIRKMDQEQKRRSCSSATNSINLRNGAFSPMIQPSHASTFSTRQRSVSGASRLGQVSEPGHDEDGHAVDPTRTASNAGPIPSHASYAHEPSESLHDQYLPEHDEVEDPDRPASAASGDTFQQARTLFTDFDGVHFTPLDRGNSTRQMSLQQPPLASRPQPYQEPQMGQNMVYYPAPVPRMLNLPPKLSRRPIADREKRRTELLTSIVAEDRKSALWLPGADQHRSGPDEQDKRQSKISPHLRANLFFDKPSTALEVDVKQQSAVATLDSILDASTYAPVSAFTDHPFAGHVGSQVFHQPKRQTVYKDHAEQAAHRASQISMGQRLSLHSRGQVGGQSAAQARHDDRARSHNEDGSEGASESESDDEGDSLTSGLHEEENQGFVEFVGPPNTLLAELDLRKQELRQRQRVFLPTPSQVMGGHSTLLEMDALAQRQSDKRRRRPVTLAWNNRDTPDDDDVPLAMLYADQAPTAEEDRPLGLMERRQLEENEPLSTRRARLRGEPLLEKQPVSVHEAEVHVSDAGEPAADSEDEGETLAERLRRLRGQNPAESDFASEVLAEINSKSETAPPKAEPISTAAGPENETLAQRRLRLQKENGPARGHPARDLHPSRSMAALPQLRHAQRASLARHASHDVLPYGNAVAGQYAGRMSTQSLLLNPTAQQGYGGYPMGQQPYAYGNMNYPAAQAYNSMMMGVPGGMVYAMPAGCGPNMAPQPVNPAQQEFIDRWRQSIR
ncbi:hypothetical protein PDE_08600 [Penicillium oxalicum 114-2]|uniref:Uncharacterized protein n=1 Tax=Penicillium oxalicum (strain 114-2 / CGMCC 5302) TaxID=933388 RepID=S8B473_PENO1|nr:hypothetical protein PDE_08600 [Penicillium oxalicum 114-2]